ncbi:hypothetical protein SY89_00685 [Halolamina pelagica]|uniref:Uncharacterized protein n=2 Tax=Halolamina pelagica TaxID=699431 RepID=A0A0P7HTJ4_9EURY|nr:hypothetical protein SY89_00685 [Halolamina pelagica]
MLLAVIPGDDNKAKFRLSGQEKLAQQMVNKEGLSLNPSKVNWASNSERNNFQSKFNARASSVELRATWTRNKYRLRDKPRYIVRSSS